MTRLIKIGLHELNPTIRVLSDAGATTEDADWIRSPGNAKLVVDFIHGQIALADINPFKLSVEETLRRLREASEQEGWGIGEDVFERLANIVPEWPKGRFAFRSLRIRFGEGNVGVQQTFKAHAARIKRTFDPKFWRREGLLAGKAPSQEEDGKRLRLLAGDETHKPVIEWVTFDLNANRQRKSVSAVRSPKSLADEGLAFTWLFREYPPAINYADNPAYFLGGYELMNVPEGDGGSWQDVPCVGRVPDTDVVFLNAHEHGSDHSHYSVPSLWE